MALHKIINGKRVDLTSEEEESRKAEWAANEAKAKAYDYAAERKKRYPLVEEQLDVLWKYFTTIQSALTPEMKDIVNRINLIKKKYPKPTSPTEAGKVTPAGDIESAQATK